MRIVQWASEERVDVPDITAMSFLALGEFRRNLRALIVGESANYIVRGFAAIPATIPDTTVTIKLDPGGGNPLSVALGAENTGAVDYGQLIGDKDSNGATEGNAQQVLDFTGQPNGTYTVQIRFAYASGANDNRAFWNPGTDVEFIAPTDTRFLPTWEARFSGSPSGEWINLASVVWGGATIVAGNITDLRQFAFEGTTPFQSGTQTGPGSISDFDRNVDRTLLSVERNEVYKALRGLARQVQDLKGPSDAGQWDWFSHIYKTYDPNAALTLGRTKSLRSIDTLTLTCADGVAEWGDFNGSTAVDDALTFISGFSGAQCPNRIDIVIKGSGSAFTWSGQKLLVCSAARGTIIRIRGACDNRSTGANVQGRPTITCDLGTLGNTNYMLKVTGTGGHHIILEDLNVQCSGSAATGKGMFSATGYIKTKHCSLKISTGSPDASAGYVLQAGDASNSIVSYCEIVGPVQFYNTGFGSSILATAFNGCIEHTLLTEARIALKSDSALGATTPDAANGFRISDCRIDARTAAKYTGSLGTIDGGSSVSVLIDHITLNYGANEDGIAAYLYNTYSPRHWKIKNSILTTDFATSSSGWAIHLFNASADFVADSTIEDCLFKVIIASGSTTGTINLTGAKGVVIAGCKWRGCGHANAGGTSIDAISLSPHSIGASSRIDIHDCIMEDWVPSGGTDFIRVLVNLGCSDLKVHHCQFTLRDSSGSFIATQSTSLHAIDLVSSLRCSFDDCTFDSWQENTTHDSCIQAQTSCDDLQVRKCTFFQCGGYVVRGDGSNWNIAQNTVRAAATNGNGIDLRGVTNAVCCGNGFIQPGGGIAVNVDSSRYVVMGNDATNGSFHRVSGSGVGYFIGPAYANAGVDDAILNFFVAYT